MIPFLLLAPAALVSFQDEDLTTLRFRVTAIDGRFVDLDIGAQQGLREGDELRLLPDTLGTRPASVIQVSPTTARAEIVGSLAGIEVGTLGEAKIPRTRLVPLTPEHPPWTKPIEAWSEDWPLLQATAKVTPEERPRRLSGRVWFGNDARSTEFGDYQVNSGGLSLDAENPFGQGGLLDAELRFIDQSASGATTSGDLGGALRIERLSFVLGGDRTAPHRWQVGRFLSREVPEFGVLDGVEYTERFDSGLRLGGSVGYLPDLSGERTTGETLATQIFARAPLDLEQNLEVGAAVQETWHKGDKDREALLLSGEWLPDGPWSLRATTLFDRYDGTDQFKDGVELTEGRMSLGYGEKNSGGSFSLTRTTWPELLRNEFPDQIDEILAEGRVDRADVYAWTKAGDWRLSGGVNRWSDQEDSGGGFTLRGSLRDSLFQKGEVGGALTSRTGRFLEGETAQIFAAWWGGVGSLRGSLDLSNVDTTAGSAISDLWLRLSWSTSLGRDWNLSLRAFRQQGDADSTGFTIQLARFF